MRRFTRLALVVLVIPLLAACRLGTPGANTEIGSGNAATETREVGAFDRLDVSAAIQATVMVGTPASVTVIADDNLLDNVVTTVSGTRLTVGMSGSISTRTTVRVDIVAPSLTAIHAGSAATVEVQGLTADQLRLEADSAGRIIAAGTAPTIDLRAGSAGELRLDDLSVDRATVSIDSAGHAWLNAAQEVTGSVTSAGTLTLVVKPVTVNVETDLTGNVVQQ